MSQLCIWSFDSRYQRKFMDDRVLIMIYESLAKGLLKCHILDIAWSLRR